MKESNLRKFSIAVATLLATSTAFTAADIDSRVTQLENQMQQIRTENAMGSSGASTAPSRVEVDGYGVNLNLDLFF